jgi:hypothetical protein
VLLAAGLCGRGADEGKSAVNNEAPANVYPYCLPCPARSSHEAGWQCHGPFGSKEFNAVQKQSSPFNSASTTFLAAALVSIFLGIYGARDIVTLFNRLSVPGSFASAPWIGLLTLATGLALVGRGLAAYARIRMAPRAGSILLDGILFGAGLCLAILGAVLAFSKALS